MLSLKNPNIKFVASHFRLLGYLAKSFHRLFGGERLHCSVCDRDTRFLAYGQPPRYNALCPYCGSLERHRLLYLWLKQNEATLRGADMLHFAPEHRLEQYLRGLSQTYVSADYAAGRADRQMNIECIDAGDESFDLIVCLHVLEHVDDIAALSELARVLRPGGRTILMFPIVEGWPRTLEEADIGVDQFTRRDRIKYFGQFDHVRYYGRDVRDRIRAAGFELNEFIAEEPDVGAYGLQRGQTIFCATKPA